MLRSIWVMASLGCLLCLLFAACDGRVSPQREWRVQDHGQPEQVDPTRTETEVAPEQGGPERAADALYSVSCAGCHGRDGRGGGEARPPGAELPDFTAEAFQKQRSDDELLLVLRNGRGLMPPFGKQMNEQGLHALVGRVRRFVQPPVP